MKSRSFEIQIATRLYLWSSFKHTFRRGFAKANCRELIDSFTWTKPNVMYGYVQSRSGDGKMRVKSQASRDESGLISQLFYTNLTHLTRWKSVVRICKNDVTYITYVRVLKSDSLRDLKCMVSTGMRLGLLFRASIALAYFHRRSFVTS